MIYPRYFIDRVLQVGFMVALHIHHIFRANSGLTIKPNYSKFETRFSNKILGEMVTVYCRIININLLIEQDFQQDLMNKMKIDRF